MMMAMLATAYINYILTSQKLKIKLLKEQNFATLFARGGCRKAHINNKLIHLHTAQKAKSHYYKHAYVSSTSQTETTDK